MGKKNIALLFIIFLVWPLILFAATRNIVSTGNWTDTGPWTGGIIPISTDDVTMDNSTGITVQNTENISVVSLLTGNSNTITIDAGGTLTLNNSGLDALTTANNTTINVSGDLTINGNLNDLNSLIFNITGTVTINGNLIMNNNATIDVAGSGILIINGDFIGANNTDVNVDGLIDVSGDVNVGNNSDLTGSGTFSVEGECTDETSGFCESGVLPIKLHSFGATVDDARIKLDWSTYEEENFDYFCIEKSLNGLEFESIEKISGKWVEGITNYTHYDNNPTIGRSYYRLKAVDLNGSSEYFKIISVSYIGNINISIYPNPTFNNYSLKLNFAPKENLLLMVYGQDGRIVDSMTIIANETFIQPNQPYESGLYLLQVTNNRDLNYTKKLLIR